MMSFLITYVVPQFANLYRAARCHLPPMTMVMLAIGVNAQQYAPYVALGIDRGWLFHVALDEERSRLHRWIV